MRRKGGFAQKMTRLSTIMHDWTRLGTIGHDFGLRQGFGATRGRPQAAHRCPNPILAFFAIWIHKIKNLFLASSTFIHLDSPSFGFIDLHWNAAGFNAKWQCRKDAISPLIGVYRAGLRAALARNPLRGGGRAAVPAVSDI